MNIIEAIKSGANFYRQSWKDKTTISFEQIGLLSLEAFLADDWEVEDKSVTITREQFNEAWDRAICNMENGIFTGERLAKELGL